MPLAQNRAGWGGIHALKSNIKAHFRITVRHLSYTRLLQALSNLALNASRGGAATASLGNLWQCLTNGLQQHPSDP